MKENEEHYPGVQDSFNACGVADFVGQKLTKWNEELIMQFYSTTHFYPDGRITWMSEGTRYQSTVAEWAQLINAPEEQEDDLDVYAKKKMDHNSMSMSSSCSSGALINFAHSSTVDWYLVPSDIHVILPSG